VRGDAEAIVVVAEGLSVFKVVQIRAQLSWIVRV
jgi:hypothetical protein